MRIAAVLFVAAAAFAWLAVHGVLGLHPTGTAPPAIVLDRGAARASAPTGRRGGRVAVPRMVERAPLRGFPTQGARP